MKQKLLLKTMLLLCALIAGSSSVWAEDLTVSWTASTGALGSAISTVNGTATGTIATGSFNWNYTRTLLYLASGKSDYIAMSSGYMQCGSSNAKESLSFTTSNIQGIIKSVSVDCYSKDGKHNLSITVGGNSYLNVATPSSGTTKTGTGTSSGEIEISFTLTNPSSQGAALYVKSISVTYTPSGGGTPTVETPTFYPGTGTYTTAQNVTLGCTTDGATIHYTMTTDGSTPDDPTESDPTYTTSPISVTLTGTKIKAKAFKAGSNASSVASATYTIQPTKPTFEVTTVVAGKVNRGTQLTMSAAAGNTIIYTTDGTAASYSEPNGDIYETPITINNPMTIKAIAVDGYGNESQQTIATYAIYYAGGVDITPNYSFFGKTGQFSGTDFDEVTGTTAEGIVVTYTRNDASLYANTTSMRFYKKNTLKIDAPAGKTITNVVFTQGNAQTDDMTSTPDGYSSTTKTWSGDASSVTFTRPSTADSYLQFTKIEVVLANKATIAAACTDGEGMYYGTYSSGKAFKVPADLVVSEINVDNGKLQLSNYSTGDVVPANTGVMIASNAAGNYTLEIATGGTSVLGSDNMLKPSGDTDIDDDAMAAAAPSCKYYRLTMHNGTQIGFWWGAAGGAAFDLVANKAYLAVPTGAGAPSLLWFDNGSTGVNTLNVERETLNGEYYNLAGQRVANPTKGLYIVNGRKVVIK